MIGKIMTPQEYNAFLKKRRTSKLFKDEKLNSIENIRTLNE